MSEDKQQSVTEATDDQAKPDTEADGAQGKPEDDLENALKEFEAHDAGSASTEQSPAAKPDPTQERIARLEKTLAEREYRDDMVSVISTVRGDFTPDVVKDEFIDLWVNAEAQRDARVRQAWLKRHEDPKGFQRVANGLARKFAETYAHVKKHDDGATADREAVATFVRGAKQSAPVGKAPDLSKMTDAQLREYKESLGM